MDQIKIGKFISERRKRENLTQSELAEKLGVTDRAVSKWETGKSMPDYSIMQELCKILKITVNDLLCGEVVIMDNYNKELENNLLKAVKEKQESDKRLLNLEIFIGVTATLLLFTLVLIAGLVEMKVWAKVFLIIIGFAQFLVGCFFALRIEQVAGYYECKNCKHKYVPTYKAVNMAPHLGRTRKMKCPNCGKRTLSKKVLTK